MKKEDSKNKQTRRRTENREHKEEMFTKEQVISLAQLITAGVMGIGGQECVEQAQELPKHYREFSSHLSLHPVSA